MSTPEQQGAFLNALFEIGRHDAFPMHLSQDRVTKSELYMLYLIHAHNQHRPDAKGMYVSELTEQMRVTPPAVSRMLRGMETKGYVERVVDRSDRRTTYIVLTPAAAALRKRVEQRALDFSGRILDRMGAADIETLVTLWRRLKVISQEELAKERSQTCANCSNTSNNPR